MKLAERGTPLTWGDYVQDDDTTDIVLVVKDKGDYLPILVVPVSERAVSLFTRWGMKEGVTGIAPPYDPIDLITSVPGDWITKAVPYIDGLHNVTEVPLPQKLIVVH